MTEKNKVVIPTKSFSMHKMLKDELINNYVPIPSAIPIGFTSHTPSKTVTLYNTIARAGYFRPKIPQTSEVQIRPSKIYPNYMKRDPREYPPIHCCQWRPKSTTGEANTIQPVLPRTKFVHHTIYDTGKYINFTDTPTVKAINKTVFGNTITTPINLLATDSAQLEPLEKPILDADELDQEDNILQPSETSSFSKMVSPVSTNGFNITRKTFRGDPVKAEKFREKFESTQKDFRKLQVRIDELARKKRGWYQENMHEASEVKEKIKEGSLLLKTMDSSHHREEIRHAVRMSAVHAHYEKNWKRLGLKSVDNKEQEESARPTSKLRHLLVEAKQEMRKVVNSTPDLIKKRTERLTTE